MLALSTADFPALIFPLIQKKRIVMIDSSCSGLHAPSDHRPTDNQTKQADNQTKDRQKGRQDNQTEDRQTDNHTEDRQTDRQTDNQTEGVKVMQALAACFHNVVPTDKQTDRQIDRQTDRQNKATIHYVMLKVMQNLTAYFHNVVLTDRQAEDKETDRVEQVSIT